MKVSYATQLAGPKQKITTRSMSVKTAHFPSRLREVRECDEFRQLSLLAMGHQVPLRLAVSSRQSLRRLLCSTIPSAEGGTNILRPSKKAATREDDVSTTTYSCGAAGKDRYGQSETKIANNVTVLALQDSHSCQSR